MVPVATQAPQASSSSNPPARRLASPPGEPNRVPSTKWERRRGLVLRAQPKGIADSDGEDWGAWTPDAKHIIPQSPMPVAAAHAKGGKDKGKSPPGKGQGKGKGKVHLKKDKKARKSQDYQDSRALATVLRHGSGKQGAAVLAQMGSQGEVSISVLSEALKLPEARLRYIVDTSVHPSGDHRYERLSWDGCDFIRATGKHSLEIAGADHQSAV